MIALDARPRLASKARLRFDRKSERHMLLYPERGLVLSPTAADVVQRCTGELSVQAIIDQLAEKYASPRETLEREVLSFLGEMSDRALVHWAEAAQP